MKWRLLAEQIHLLHAALCSGDAAHNAWYRWRKTTGFEQLDVASYRLLPLLLRNL
jgi:hypothetical protein